MEEEFRRKAAAGLAALLVLFSVTVVFTMNIEPERVAIIYTHVDASETELDSLNITELRDYFNTTEFLANYSVGPSDCREGGMLVIVPLNNPDVAITLCQCGCDIFLLGEMYSEFHPLFNDKSFSDLGKELMAEMSALLAIMGLSELSENVVLDDYDFAGLPNMLAVIAFFGLLSAIFTYAFMMFYKGGYLLENFLGMGLPAKDYVGLSMMFFSAGFGLMGLWFGIWYDIADNAFCMGVLAMLFVVGLYLIVAGKAE